MISQDDCFTLVNDAIDRYSGNARELERAIGALFLGRKYGWKVLLLIHDPRVFEKYEHILGVKFRDVMPDVGRLANRSLAYKVVQTVSSYWDAVKGKIPGCRSPELQKI